MLDDTRWSRTGARRADDAVDDAAASSGREETPGEAHARLVRECAETLYRVPGRRGRLLRLALATGWC